MECYKVMFSCNGKRINSVTFNDYDDALNHAMHMSDSKGYFALILEFDIQKGKWKKRCSIYPNE